MKTILTRNRDLLDWLDSIVLAMLVIVLLFTFVVRVVRVDGHSMQPGLQNDDKILIASQPYQPRYGDVVVVDSYIPHGLPLIKRVIGLPGDTIDIDYTAGTVYRNGTALAEPYTAEPTYLAETVSFPLTVPEGTLFLMGDNRNNSADSRDSRIGCVDCRDILGRALVRIWPLNKAGGIA